MYIKSFDKQDYDDVMEALKTTNRLLKDIEASKQYKVGKYLMLLSRIISGKEKVYVLPKRIIQSYRWHKVCKKYPITHNGHVNETPSNYYSDEEIIIYTAVFGKYDTLHEPLVKPNNCKFIVITDQEVPQDSVWKPMDESLIFPNNNSFSNAEKNRYCKMFPHRIFTNKLTIYLDGNVQPITDLTELINTDLKFGMQFHKHKARECVYDEMDACSILKKSSKKALNQYKKRLMMDLFPTHYGMVECNVIVRDSSNIVMHEVMKDWWDEFINNDVKRDQLSLPYVLWKHNICIDNISKLGSNVEDNDALHIYSHS